MTIELTKDDLEGHIRALTDKYDNDFSIGSLDSQSVAKLLTNAANALDKIYPTTAGSGVQHTLYERVDARGRYGAWKFTAQQLVDAGAIDQSVIPWAAKRLSGSGDGPYVAERRSSWADEVLKKYGPDGDDEISFSSPRTEERNNIQYYLLANKPPAEIKISNKMVQHGDSPFATFVSSSEIVQVYFAYEYLQFVYKMFVTARVVNEVGPSPEVIAGLLSIALCESYDAAINFAHNVIKTNTDGVSARYWYDIGWNSIAKVPLGTTEAAPVPDPATTAVTNVKSIATSEEPQEGAAAAVTSTTTDSGNPKATADTSDTAPTPASPEEVAAAKAAVTTTITEMYNNVDISVDRIAITYSVDGEQGAKGNFSGRVVFNPIGLVLASSTANNRESIRTELLSQLDAKESSNQLKLNNIASNVASSNPLIVNSGDAELIYHWLGSSGTVTLKYRDDIISSCSVSDTTLGSTEVLRFSADVEDKANSFTGQKKLDILNVFQKLSVSTFVSVKELYDVEAASKELNDLLDNIPIAKAAISQSFDSDTLPLETYRNTLPTPPAPTTTVGEDGSTATSQTNVFSDGSETTVTLTENPDGTVSKKKEVVPVAPPLAEKKTDLLEQEGNVPHPETDAGISEGPNSLASNNAQNRPQNLSTSNQQNTSKGFQDPSRVYPSKDHQNKPDTNPLAVGENSTHIQHSPKTPAGDKSGMSRGASPAARNATRKREVKMAGRNGATWSQPESPYAAQYPYNKVFGGESGHAIEIDDTPGAERLNFAHRSGTYDEIGPDGTKVTRIVGDGYTIYDRDGYIMIEGQANVHVAGACNVYIAGDTNLTMHGKASIDIHNDLDLNVGGHIAVTAGKGIFVRNQGIFSLDNVGDIEMRGKGNLTQEVVGTYNVTTTAGYNMTSKADSHVKIVGVSYTTSKGDMNFCTEGVYKAKSTGDMNLKTAAVMKQESAGDFNQKSGAVMNTESAGVSNVKSGGAVNVEGAGNINLKAPLVASSPIDTSTLDVSTANISTLNAGSTNLQGVDPQGGTVTPIQGGTTASVTAPGAAAAAEAAAEADCAQAAPLSAPVALERPVSISRGASPKQSMSDSGNAGTGANGPGGSGTGGETPQMANDGGDTRDTSCVTGSDGTTSNGDPTQGDTGGASAVGPYNPAPNGNYNKSPSGRVYPLPTVTGRNIPQTLQLSDHYTVRDLMAGSYYKGYYQSVEHWGVQDILVNLQAMANLVLEPLRARYPGFTMTSGYRTYPYHPGNGASLSAHHIGAGIDIQYPGRNYAHHIEVGNWLARNISVDQVIYECRSWIHIGLYSPRGRGRVQRHQWFESDRNGHAVKMYNRGV